MAEENSMFGKNMWAGLNTVLGVGALASALGIGIPAIVKANDAQDDDHRRHNGEDLHTKVALLEQANIYNKQINDLQLANMKQYVDGTFMRGQLYLPSFNVTPLPMNRFNSWQPPFVPEPPTSVSSSTSTSTNNG